eukprot:364207-Chlamydomonas_euryale.AAC.2
MLWPSVTTSGSCTWHAEAPPLPLLCHLAAAAAGWPCGPPPTLILIPDPDPDHVPHLLATLTLIHPGTFCILFHSAGMTGPGQYGPQASALSSPASAMLHDLSPLHVAQGDYGDLAPYVAERFRAPGSFPKLKKPLPSEGSVYDWVWDGAKGCWLRWMDTVGTQRISADAEYSQIIVTTVDVVRTRFLLSTMVSHGEPMLLVGATGTGKSAYVKAFLAAGLDRAKWVSMAFNFSAQTSANMTQVCCR